MIELMIFALCLLGAIATTIGKPRQASLEFLRNKNLSDINSDLISALEHAVYMQKAANDLAEVVNRINQARDFADPDTTLTREKLEDLEREYVECMRCLSGRQYEFTKRLKKASTSYLNKFPGSARARFILDKARENDK